MEACNGMALQTEEKRCKTLRVVFRSLVRSVHTANCWVGLAVLPGTRECAVFKSIEIRNESERLYGCFMHLSMS